VRERHRDQKDDYHEMLQHYISASTQAFATLGQTPAEVADVIVEIANCEMPDFRYQTSEVSSNIAKIKLVDATGNTTIGMTRKRLSGN
jgi:hypothetical protein